MAKVALPAFATVGHQEALHSPRYQHR